MGFYILLMENFIDINFYRRDTVEKEKAKNTDRIF